MDQRELPFARVCQISAFSFVNRLASHVVYLPAQRGRELGKARVSLSLSISDSAAVQPRLSGTLLSGSPLLCVGGDKGMTSEVCS